jgi:CIC family chloride channel protein
MSGNNPLHGKHLHTGIFASLAVLVGVAAGLGAVLLRALIAFFHNLLFAGEISLTRDALVHTPPSPWGVLVVLVPAIGALGVAYLVKNHAPEAKGTGVPEVIDAIYYKKGVVRPVVALVKSLASALSIGSGAPVGREGPIIQIGSSFGSTIGQIIPMSSWQRITLVAAGAGGGISATFNTPIGGVLFATEIMLHEVSVRTLVPVAISSAVGAYVGQLFFGPLPSFSIPHAELSQFYVTNHWVLLAYALFGVLIGLVSAGIIKAVYAAEDLFDRHLVDNYYVKHLTGMLMVGIMMYLLLRGFGHYYIEGVGYATIQDVLENNLTVVALLLLLAVLKLLALSLSLGSGASGGIFSPTLYIGATLGGAYGILLQDIFPSLGVSVTAFVVAGMAGAIGGATGAALAAIVMIFEMTLDYNAIIPMTITVAVSDGIRRMLMDQTMYTLKLARRGHYMPRSLQTNFYLLKHARDVMEAPAVSIPAAAALKELAPLVLAHRNVSHFMVEEGGAIKGIVGREAALDLLAGEGGRSPVGERAGTDYIVVAEDTQLFDIVDQMHLHRASVAFVSGGQPPASASMVKGYITRGRIADVMQQDFDLLAQ